MNVVNSSYQTTHYISIELQNFVHKAQKQANEFLNNKITLWHLRSSYHTGNLVKREYVKYNHKFQFTNKLWTIC